MVMVWMYILGWSTYGPEAAATFAPEYKDTANDTRKALANDRRPQRHPGGLLPIAVLGTIGYDGLLADALGVAWLVDVSTRSPGTGSGSSSSSVSALACCSR